MLSVASFTSPSVSVSQAVTGLPMILHRRFEYTKISSPDKPNISIKIKLKKRRKKDLIYIYI